MSMFLTTFALTVTLIALAIAGISIKSFFVKGGKFNGSCAQNNPLLKNQIGECTVCGQIPSENCEVDQKSSALPKI